MVRQRVEAFLRGESRGLLPALIRAPLVPAALLYGLGATLRRRAYRVGILGRERLPVPVISIGNFVLGGTGKTPFVRLVCALLEDLGEKPLVVGRGYGARAPGDDLDEEGRSLARDLPGVRVVQGTRRAARARSSLGEHADRTVVVLDDGAQTLGVDRDLEILLVDAVRPYGSGWPLPAGSLREFPRSLVHADVVVVTRSNEATPNAVQRLERDLAKRFPRSLLMLAEHVPSRVFPPIARPSVLEGVPVFLVSGIANSRSFEQSVRCLGAQVRGHAAYPDHFAFAPSDLARATSAALAAGAVLLLATGKDEPKLARLPTPALPLRYLEVSVAIRHARTAELRALLDSTVRSHRDAV